MRSRVSDQINLHTAPHGIVTFACDVFEEIVLSKLAKITTKPTFCQFNTLGNDDKQTYFDIRGISEKEADQLLDYFKNCGDQKATKEYIEPCELEIPGQNYDVFHFVIDTGIALEKVVPGFIKAFDEIAENSPQDLEKYKKQSTNDKGLPLYKLLSALNNISQNTAYLLVNNNVNAELKNDVENILNIINAAIKGYAEHIQHDNCTIPRFYGAVIEPASKMFSLMYNDEKSNLKSDEKAQQLQNSLNILGKTIATSKLGLFKIVPISNESMNAAQEQGQTLNQDPPQGCKIS